MESSVIEKRPAPVVATAMKAAAFMAVATTEPFHGAGERIYRLTTRLHASAAEASEAQSDISLTVPHAITPLDWINR